MRGREKIDGIRSVKRTQVEALGQLQGRKRNVNLYNIIEIFSSDMYLDRSAPVTVITVGRKRSEARSADSGGVQIQDFFSG